jgi:hypothetical protein
MWLQITAAHSLDKKIINQENKDAITAVTKVDIEEIAL